VVSFAIRWLLPVLVVAAMLAIVLVVYCSQVWSVFHKIHLANPRSKDGTQNLYTRHTRPQSR
jgi:hypothetical protein